MMTHICSFWDTHVFSIKFTVSFCDLYYIISYPVPDQIMDTLWPTLEFSGKDKKAVNQNLAVINKLSEMSKKEDIQKCQVVGVGQ